MNSNDKYHEDQQHRISKVEKFNEWMQEIKSIYYANNKAMNNAFNKIYNEELSVYRQVIETVVKLPFIQEIIEENKIILLD